MSTAPDPSTAAGAAGEDRRARCVVVGYDGTLEGWNALRWALSELDHPGCVVVVSAVGRERAIPLLDRLTGDDALVRARLEALWMEDTEVLDEELELVVDEGHPAEALIRHARERDARMIVVGHRHRGAMGVVHASVAHDLLERSPVPVVVVP